MLTDNESSEEEKCNERSFEQDQIRIKLNVVHTWMQKPKNEWFNGDFINSLDTQFKKRGKLSPKQIKALNNIIMKVVNRK